MRGLQKATFRVLAAWRADFGLEIRANSCLEEEVVTNYRDMAPAEPTLPVPPELRLEKKTHPGTREMMEILRDCPAEASAVLTALDFLEDMTLGNLLGKIARFSHGKPREKDR
jgi:hypothetical protein